MQKFYKATLETRHFSFEAFGEDDLAALRVLKEGVQIHCKQYEADFGRLWREVEQDAKVSPWLIGRAYRDGEPLK